MFKLVSNLEIEKAYCVIGEDFTVYSKRPEYGKINSIMILKKLKPEKDIFFVLKLLEDTRKYFKVYEILLEDTIVYIPWTDLKLTNVKEIK